MNEVYNAPQEPISYVVPMTNDDSQESPEGVQNDDTPDTPPDEPQEPQKPQDTYTQEEIENRLTDLSAKPENELTDDEKQFIADNTPKNIIDIAKTLVSSNYSVEFDQEDVIDNTEDGLNSLFRKVYDRGGQDNLRREYEKYPELESFHKYLNDGGDPQRYMNVMYPEIDFSRVQINVDGTEEQDIQAMNYVLAFDLQTQGYTNEQIREIIDNYDKSGVRGKMAELSLSKLVAYQKNQKDTLLLNQENEKKRMDDEYEAFKNAEKERIKKAKDFGTLPIAERDKDDFFNFLFKTRKDSQIQEIPISQEILYHALNSESKLYGQEKYSKLRDAIHMFTFMYERDPEFINKLVANRAGTMKAQKQLPGFTPVDRMKSQQGYSDNSNTKQPEFQGTPMFMPTR